MYTAFNGNPYTMVVSSYSPINTSDEMDITITYDKLSSFAWYIPKHNLLIIWRGCLRHVMVKVLACGIVVSKFKLQSHYYIHFSTNTLGKDMNPLFPPAMG